MVAEAYNMPAATTTAPSAAPMTLTPTNSPAAAPAVTTGTVPSVVRVVCPPLAAWAMVATAVGTVMVPVVQLVPPLLVKTHAI